MSFKPFAKTALWAGGGAYVGVLVGSILIDARSALFWMVPWTAIFLAYLAVVLSVGREKLPRRLAVAQAPSRDAGRARPPASALDVDLDLPDIPSGLPPVVGVADALRVLVTVRGSASDGTAVRLVAQLRDGARSIVGEGVAGTDGTVAFTLRAPATGELILEAEARQGEQHGIGRTSLSVVRYSEEIERLFAEFRDYAHASLGPSSQADTARELAEKLRAGASSAAGRALLELARIYELVAYGERDADRALYLALVRALLVLERDSESSQSEPVTARGA